SNTAGDTRFDTRANSRTMIGTNEFRNCLGNDTCVGSGVGLRTVYFKFNNGAASTLSYSTYGRWARIEAVISPVELGVFATGLPSTTAQVPTAGTATFTGGATGFLYGATTADSLAIQGNATLNVDFAARTVSGGISSITASSVTGNTQAGTIGNITLSAGTISGATFTGTATGTALTGAVQDINASTGQFGGAFYGPNAQEAAGSFALTGPNRSVVGAFGVKR
ncbi:MAG: transferrin-binding protein-like solute binding protein, partial [Rhodospirillaceae bacterium]|nr:transferrin-binding protein-like solute binding protein [Rhodospirillaceae bacterium]